MARKSNKKSSNNFFRTRTGFYMLVVLAAVGFISTIKIYSNSEAVLGERDERRGPDPVKQKEHEDHVQEIEDKFNVNPEGLQVEVSHGKSDENEQEHQNKPEISHLSDDQKEKLKDTVVKNFEDENEASIASDEGGTTIEKDHVKVRTGFPLSIDVSSGQLIVTRPDGTTKNVAVLPDQAIENFMRNKKVNLINVPPTNTGSGSATTTPDSEATSSAQGSSETEVKLVEKDNKLVYEIKGKKKLKVLGFIPVETDTTGYVSAENGDVVGQDESPFTKFLNFISF